ncbi:tripartite tricarboxylate transporter substrate binding protein [Falsiroseomonas sp.]|uniref:Bug family tripartite tricarboxylate transporter substrate binding protein n=1 Tax=Falsiroseomonas sp. TaxID=2870721 RepID=UPI00272D1226|nr:tripartite tricarboxylate transporter substrate binding protein [Falsiroseomonas sp.]
MHKPGSGSNPLPCRRWLTLALLAGMMAPLPAEAQTAAAFPDRPLRLIVGFAAGGTTDIVARVMAEAMAPDLGQQIVVENRGGAGGIPAAQVMLNLPADGHVLMLQSGGLNQAEAMGSPMPFDAVTAFAPIGLVATSAISLVVHPSIPATNLAELQAYARTQPNPLRFGSPGISLSTFLYAQELGIEVEEVRYRGTGAVLNDLLAGRLHGYTIALPGILSNVRAGGLRAIALAAERRSAVMPELATTVEQGFPNIITASWFGLVARAGTPEDRLQRLGEAMSAAIARPVIRSRLTEAGLDVVERTDPASFNALIVEDRARWETVVRRGNLRP